MAGGFSFFGGGGGQALCSLGWPQALQDPVSQILGSKS